MFNVVNSSNGIIVDSWNNIRKYIDVTDAFFIFTVERNEKGEFKISGDFKVPFDELPKEEQKDILKLISESKKIES